MLTFKVTWGAKSIGWEPGWLCSHLQWRNRPFLTAFIFKNTKKKKTPPVIETFTVKNEPKWGKEMVALKCPKITVHVKKYLTNPTSRDFPVVLSTAPGKWSTHPFSFTSDNSESQVSISDGAKEVRFWQVDALHQQQRALPSATLARIFCPVAPNHLLHTLWRAGWNTPSRPKTLLVFSPLPVKNRNYAFTQILLNKITLVSLIGPQKKKKTIKTNPCLTREVKSNIFLKISYLLVQTL